MKTGIYKIINNINGRFYIGSSKRYDTHGSSYPSLVNNNGDIVPAGHNIRRLAKKLDVNPANLHQVICGKRKTAGGWRIL